MDMGMYIRGTREAEAETEGKETGKLLSLAGRLLDLVRGRTAR